MTRKLSVLAILFALSSVGCDKIKGLADFEVSVSNRLNHTILFYANGEEQGEIGPNRAQAFTLKLKTIETGGGTFTSPSSSAAVTFAARDVVSMKLSRERKETIYQDRPKNVEFTVADF